MIEVPIDLVGPFVLGLLCGAGFGYIALLNCKWAGRCKNCGSILEEQ
jgi:hypothetical protein